MNEQHVSVPSPETTLIIMLGASTWPFDSDEFPPSDAFALAAQKMRAYFTITFGVPESQLLWLFDKELDAIKMGEEITGHLQKFRRTAKDVIVYYVGHAKLTRKYRQLYLAIRDTQKEIPEDTSLKTESLAETVRRQAGNLRRFYILDCDFAARALTNLQGLSETELVRDTFEEVEYTTQGYAALLSSDKYSLTAILPDQTNTYFTAALLHVLVEEKLHSSNALSFQDIYDNINPRLTTLYQQYHADPEMLESPMVTIYGEDLTKIPLFPNMHIGPGTPRDLTPTESEVVGKQATNPNMPVASQLISVQKPPVRPLQVGEGAITGTFEMKPTTQKHQTRGRLVPQFSPRQLSSVAQTGIFLLLRRHRFLTLVLIALVLIMSFSSLYVQAYTSGHSSHPGSQKGTPSINGTASQRGAPPIDSTASQRGTPPIDSTASANFIAFSNSSFSINYPRGWTHKQSTNNFVFSRWDNVTHLVVSVNNYDQSSTEMLNNLIQDPSCTQQNAQEFSSVVVSNQTWQQSIWNCMLASVIYVVHVLTFVDAQTNDGTAILYADYQQVLSSKMVNFDQANVQYFQPMLQSFHLK